MSETQDYDILICGAGPAGSTCALALGESGLKVALVDKSTFPRDKICGDAVAAYVPAVLGTINPVYETEFNNFRDKQVVRTLRVVAPNKKIVDLNFPIDAAICRRTTLDNFLFQQVSKLPNISTLLGQGVKKVEKTEEAVFISLADGRQLSTKLLVGCDGAQGIVSKKLTDNKMDLMHNSAAVRAYYKNVAGIADQTFELHYLKDLMPGYFWIFPLPNGQANVGLGMLSKHLSKKKINLRKELTRIIENTPYLKARFAGAELMSPIKGFGLPLGSRKVTISGHRFMLCGDAAALIDPLSGEGIGQAIISGRYAGWHALKCFEKNDFSSATMLDYDKMVYDKLWRGHRNHYLVQSAISKCPWLINSLANIALSSKFMQRLVHKMLW